MSETAVPLPRRTLRTRHLAILTVVMAGIVGLVAYGPIPQDPAYHRFADARTLAGVPNAMDVLSNAAFLLSGAFGMWVVGRGRAVVTQRWESAAWMLVFGGVLATAKGSAWYHVAPDDLSLAWDRLPMTIVFGAFAALMLGERVSLSLGRRALVPFVLAGVLSIVVWQWNGDLRMYAAVQFAPMLAIVLALLALPGRYDRTGDLWIAVAFYGVAKLCEGLDGSIYEATGWISGHTLKHVAAALGPIWFVRYLTRRAPTDRLPPERRLRGLGMRHERAGTA